MATKVGCATLVMALSFTAGWVRSSLVFDLVTIPVGNHNSFSFESKRQSLCLSWTEEHSTVAIGVPFAWHAMAPMDPMAASVKGTVLWNDYMIGEFGCLVALGEEYPHGIILIAPYWSAVAALTLLSACLSAYTDEQGRYEIKGAHEWSPHPETTAKNVMQFRHPDFPLSKANFTRVPQQINVTLKPPAIIEGQVFDSITNNPVPNVTVTAQGIARHGSFTSKTDSSGRYRLRVIKDHYNIRAEMDERVSVTIKAIQAIPGETAANADIKMVKGVIIAGTLFDVKSNQVVPIPDGQTRYVGSYGPAFPSSGATPGIAKVNSDGTFRLRVAPGLNYVYFMGGDMTGYFTVKDGEELKVNLRNEPRSEFERFDPDKHLGSELRHKAQIEDAEEAAMNGN